MILSQQGVLGVKLSQQEVLGTKHTKKEACTGAVPAAGGEGTGKEGGYWRNTGDLSNVWYTNRVEMRLSIETF
jgi:hypothetical protein